MGEEMQFFFTIFDSRRLKVQEPASHTVESVLFSILSSFIMCQCDVYGTQFLATQFPTEAAYVTWTTHHDVNKNIYTSSSSNS
jgi:hypothetical protein